MTTSFDELWKDVLARVHEMNVRDANRIPRHELFEMRGRVAQRYVEHLSAVPIGLGATELMAACTDAVNRVLVELDDTSLDDEHRRTLWRYLTAMMCGVDSAEFLRALDAGLRAIGRADIAAVLSEDLGRA